MSKPVELAYTRSLDDAKTDSMATVTDSDDEFIPVRQKHRVTGSELISQPMRGDSYSSSTLALQSI